MKVLCATDAVMCASTKKWLDGNGGCTEIFRTRNRGLALRVKGRLHPDCWPKYLHLLYPRFECPKIDLLSVKKKQKRFDTKFHVLETAHGGYVLRDGACKTGIYHVNCATKAKNEAANVQYHVDANGKLCLKVIAKNGLRPRQELLVWYDVRNKDMFSV